MDRNVMFMRLSDFQDIFSMQNSVHQTVIMVDSLRSVGKVKQLIAAKLDASGLGDDLAVLDWMEIMPGLLQGIEMDLVSGLIMYVVLIIVVAFSIFNTFLMAVFERTKEFGVMLAIGTAPGRLTRLVLLESVCMTLIGIIMGMIIGSLLTLYFQKHGIHISGAEDMMKEYGLPSRLYPKLSVVSAAAGPIIVFVITFISAVFPALKIRRIKPIEAINHI
jgi:ABC-type lipoprotein release transport system permease subunit